MLPQFHELVNFERRLEPTEFMHALAWFNFAELAAVFAEGGSVAHGGDAANFGGFVLGCIGAKFCK